MTKKPHRTSQKMKTIYDQERLKIDLFEVYKKQPLSIPKFAQEIGVPASMIRRLFSDKPVYLRTHILVGNYLEKLFPDRTYARI